MVDCCGLRENTICKNTALCPCLNEKGPNFDTRPYKVVSQQRAPLKETIGIDWDYQWTIWVSLKKSRKAVLRQLLKLVKS